jgi:alpha-beta hydrolase superfamily lysophospholipase
MRRWLILIAVAFATWLLASFGAAYLLTRRPRSPFAEPPPDVTWGPLEAHRITTGDGERLGAWYAEGGDGPSVLLLHGNGGSRRNCLGRAATLSSEGRCAVLLVSLRAHGDSTGRFNDIGYSARRDVVAAVEFLRDRRPGKPVIVLGVSMGAAAALFAAEDLGEGVDGYILESPYRDLETAVWNRTRAHLPPVLDRVAYLGLRVAATVILPDFRAMSALRAIDRVPAGIPILILSGGEDALARPAEAIALYDRVRSHGRLEIIPGGDHQDLLRAAPHRWVRSVRAFCADVGRTSIDRSRALAAHPHPGRRATSRDREPAAGRPDSERR